MAHRWHFFRAGGVDQVSLRDAADLHALTELDQKLWVALAMPVKGTDLDPATLTTIDLDADGRIRVPDVLEAIAWLERTLVKPDDVLRSATEVELAAIKDTKLAATAKRMLRDLGKADATAISLADAMAVQTAFADTKLNGDGVVTTHTTDDPELKKLVEEVIAAAGSVADRSGKPGVDAGKAAEFFAAIDQRAAWIAKGRDPGLSPLGDATRGAADAIAAVRAKLEDYFTRCRIADYDGRAAEALAGTDEELVALASRSLSMRDEELAKLPLAKIDSGGKLALNGALNPAWSSRMQTFVEAALTPALGARKSLVATDLASIIERFSAFEAWRTSEPKTIVDSIPAARIEELAKPLHRELLSKLISDDAALAVEYDQIASVVKLVRLQRDFGRLLRNFVNFSEFYREQDGVFQAGTLYLDAREIRLCVPVIDAGKHAALAASSESYLLYCDITRKGETRQIACAITNGDADNLFVGRNGVFYDRAGNDWDATITKVITNPISIREAFWMPYKKLVKVIEDNVTRRAAAADAASNAKLEAVGKDVADPKLTKPSPAAPDSPAAVPAKKIDLGTVAAIGVAIGGVASLVGAILVTLFGLGPWLPFGIAGIMLLISMPSMVIAWLKLRRRNIGPMLDANGWAVNSRARINVAFGAAMTRLAKLPRGAHRNTDDPYADKRTPWKRWTAAALIILLAGAWYIGKLDRYLPRAATSVNVLGSAAPAAKRLAPASPASPQ